MPEQDKKENNEIGRSDNILIVDDNAKNAELLEVYLLPLGVDIRIAVDGIDALEKVEQQKPDVILLDIMMPRMSGFEVCRRLKGNPETEGIPIIIITALSEVGDVERGVDCGADDFISKPVNKLELVTRVKSLLRIRNLHGELERTLSYLAEVEEDNRDN